jgi:hypothetical protein
MSVCALCGLCLRLVHVGVKIRTCTAIAKRRETRSRFIYAPGRSVHGTFMSPSRILLCMGDFMFVLGTILFAVVMLGLIWGLEHV